MASAGTVSIDLDANSVKLVRELLKAQRATERTAKKMHGDLRRSFQSVTRAAGALAVSLGGVFSTQLVRDIVKVGIEFESLKRTLGVTSGSAADGAREFDFIRKVSQDLGLELRSTAKAYATLSAATAGTILQGNDTRKIFIGASQAARALGLSAEDSAGILRQFGQSAALGKINLEELKVVAERGIPVFDYLAESLGKSKEEVFDLISKGKLGSQALVGLADTLTNKFAVAATEAANDTLSAFNRLQNAWLELKATLADSGVNDLLATMASGITGILKWNEPEEQIRRVRKELDFLFRKRENQVRLSGRVDEGLNEEILALQALYSELNNQIQKNNERLDENQVEFINVSAAAQRARDALAKFNNQNARVSEAVRLFNERFSAKQALKKAVEDIKNASDELDDIFREQSKEGKKSFDEIEEAAKEAARNIQDAFADFLFDPFEDGVKGMVKSFLDAIRRMLANQAALQVFKFLRGLTGPKLEEIDISSLPKKRAMGGPVSAGTPYMVGEVGPELFVPKSSGMIVPNHKLTGGGVSISHVINVNGADPARTAELLGPILARNREQTKAEILDLKNKGRL